MSVSGRPHGLSVGTAAAALPDPEPDDDVVPVPVPDPAVVPVVAPVPAVAVPEAEEPDEPLPEEPPVVPDDPDPDV